MKKKGKYVITTTNGKVVEYQDSPWVARNKAYLLARTRGETLIVDGPDWKFTIDPTKPFFCGNECFIYDMYTEEKVMDHLACGAVSDEAYKYACASARHLRHSVIVWDPGLNEIYRVTPSGRKWRAPKNWHKFPYPPLPKSR